MKISVCTTSHRAASTTNWCSGTPIHAHVLLANLHLVSCSTSRVGVTGLLCAVVLDGQFATAKCCQPLRFSPVRAWQPNKPSLWCTATTITPHRPIKGRLLVCSNSILFDPVDQSDAILKVGTRQNAAARGALCPSFSEFCVPQYGSHQAHHVLPLLPLLVLPSSNTENAAASGAGRRR